MVEVTSGEIRQTLRPIQFLTNLVEDLGINLQRVTCNAANEVVNRRILRG